MAGEAEVGLKTAESAPSFTNTTSTTDHSQVSKKHGWKVEGLGPEPEAGLGWVALTHDLYLLVATYKKATLEVNDISSSTRIRMLPDFIYKEDIDIILLQEVTHIDFDRIRGLQRVLGLWKMNRKLQHTDTTVWIRFQLKWRRWREKYVRGTSVFFSFKMGLWKIWKTW